MDDILYTLSIHPDAAADLEELSQRFPEAALRIAVMLQEMEGDQVLLDRLTQDHFGRRGTDDFNVRKWRALWNIGEDFWRFKIWDLEDDGMRYRIFYIFLPSKKHYEVLGVLDRDFDYDLNHPATKRMRRAAEQLD